MSIPIVLSNYGNPWYLKYSLTQCKGTNPDSRVILIGDESNYGYAGVEHYHYKNYMGYAAEMAAVYKHMNTNPFKYELFCFQRWFMIYEFLKKHNISQCFIMDSDVLLYEPIDRYKTLFGDAKLTLYEINQSTHGVTGGSAFVLDVDFLKTFCDFCLQAYKNNLSEAYIAAESHYIQLQEKGKLGGVCDMTFWSMFYAKYRKSIFDTHQLLSGNVYLDININNRVIPDYTFVTEDNRKKVIFKGKTPFGIANSKSGETVEVKFPCLHFQGEVKKLMPDFITYKGYYYWYNHYYITLKNKLSRLINKQ